MSIFLFAAQKVIFFLFPSTVLQAIIKYEIENNSRIMVLATSKSRSSLHPSLVTTQGIHFIQKTLDIGFPNKVFTHQYIDDQCIIVTNVCILRSFSDANFLLDIVKLYKNTFLLDILIIYLHILIWVFIFTAPLTN